ncbi:MAG TPA: hypothetical protein VNW72_07195 [Chthoniobacterales bacterium]|jgi:hypothetical protein|nr:hypothetical protein [Chthoniobacterales bacterium]
MPPTESASAGALAMCACRGREYKVRDLIDAALFRAELDSNWRQFLTGLEAEKRAEQQDLELDHDAIDDAAELFRYAHDLITAEETEQWLEARGLNLADFTDYFTRQHWRLTIDEKIELPDVDLGSASPEQRELFTAELIFSDELYGLNRRLMWRLAALAATGENNLDPEKISAERRAFFDRTKVAEPKLNDWLSRVGRDENWLDEMLAMEVAYQSLCEKALTSEARNKQLASLRMPLTQFEAEVIELESSEAAKEALLCIRQDGMSMEEVAADARYPYRRITFLHEAVPEELKQKFWSAAGGDVLDPLPRGEGFELYRIAKKIEPDPTNPDIQRRIDEHLLERQFSALASDHVQIGLCGASVSSE